MVGATAVSLGVFDAVGGHAFAAHEDALLVAMQGGEAAAGFHRLEVHPLHRAIYSGAGKVAGSSHAAFVGVALLIGVWGPLLAARALRLLTGSRAIGLLTGALLVVHPDLAYWRVHGFHVASAHVAFCATLLLSVLVARGPSRLTFAAWFAAGAVTLYLRPEIAGAVLATAVVPIDLGGAGIVRQWRRWAPGLAIASAFLAPPTLAAMSEVAAREDYHVGLRFLGEHLAVAELFRPLDSPAAWVLAACSWLVAERRRMVGVLWAIGLAGLFPAGLFMDFGPRHLLAASTVGAAIVAVGAWNVVEIAARRGLRPVGAALATVGVGAVVLACGGVLADLGDRYGREGDVPLPVGAAAPAQALVPGVERGCASYAQDGDVCGRWEHCHPPKDLRDRDSVRRRWDDHGGCVVWGIDASDGAVSGVRHESWLVLRASYSWEPLGILPRGGGPEPALSRGPQGQVWVFRMTERP